jgi:hypothetical protein
MINEICHHIQAYTTSNECFTYSQMLHEDDRMKFFKAIEVGIHDHKERSRFYSHVKQRFTCWHQNNYGHLVFQMQDVS